jgi:8-oxo-dGTP diphosphatase
MRQLAADAVVIKDGKILLIKRGTDPFKGMWALPGGRLEEDETIEQCAIREAKEETGLDIGIQKLIGVYSDPKRDPRKVVAVAFLCELKGGKFDPMAGEIEKVDWFPLGALPRLASNHEKIVGDALRL